MELSNRERIYLLLENYGVAWNHIKVKTTNLTRYFKIGNQKPYCGNQACNVFQEQLKIPDAAKAV